MGLHAWRLWLSAAVVCNLAVMGGCPLPTLPDPESLQGTYGGNVRVDFADGTYKTQHVEVTFNANNRIVTLSRTDIGTGAGQGSEVLYFGPADTYYPDAAGVQHDIFWASGIIEAVYCSKADSSSTSFVYAADGTLWQNQAQIGSSEYDLTFTRTGDSLAGTIKLVTNIPGVLYNEVKMTNVTLTR